MPPPLCRRHPGHRTPPPKRPSRRRHPPRRATTHDDARGALQATFEAPGQDPGPARAGRAAALAIHGGVQLHSPAGRWHRLRRPSRAPPRGLPPCSPSPRCTGVASVGARAALGLLYSYLGPAALAPWPASASRGPAPHHGAARSRAAETACHGSGANRHEIAPAHWEVRGAARQARGSRIHPLNVTRVGYCPHSQTGGILRNNKTKQGSFYNHHISGGKRRSGRVPVYFLLLEVLGLARQTKQTPSGPRHTSRCTVHAFLYCEGFLWQGHTDTHIHSNTDSARTETNGAFVFEKAVRVVAGALLFGFFRATAAFPAFPRRPV